MDHSQPLCCLPGLQSKRGVSVGLLPEVDLSLTRAWSSPWLWRAVWGILGDLCVVPGRAGHTEIHLPRECSTLTESKRCQPSGQGLQGLSREPQGLGESKRNVHGTWGSNVTFRSQGDWGAPGAERAHTPRSHCCPPECPQQGRKVTKSLTARAGLGIPPGSGPDTLITVYPHWARQPAPATCQAPC